MKKQLVVFGGVTVDSWPKELAVPLQGWQPIARAVKQAKVSRQTLSRMAKRGILPNLLINGEYWLKDPLEWRPDRKRQRRAKDSA